MKKKQIIYADPTEMDFIEMWREADFVDASIGGVDSIPEEEYYDYVEACLMALSDDFKRVKVESDIEL